METTTPLDEPQARPVGRVRLLLVLALALFSPVAAESLVAYDDTTGDLLTLLGGLLIFAPLYGVPAVLIRETARRFAIGWGGVLAMAAAFGVVQAGIIDQSMFSSNYRGIDYWQDMVGPTWVDPLGLSVSASLSFVFGHMVMSFAAPIALVEGFSPRSADRPWLRPFGLVVSALLYLAAAWLVLADHLETESDHASAGQVAGAALAAVVLVALAFAFGRRRVERVERRVPPVWVIAAASAVTVFSVGFWSTWAGVALTAAVLAAMVFGTVHFARSTAWGRRQVTALAVGALLTQAVTGFLVTPLGDVDPVAKYAHNTVATLLVLLLGWWVLRRTR
jgi:hypothetical protein